MIAIVSAVLAVLVAGGFALDDGLSWWTLLIFVGSWLGFYVVGHVIRALGAGDTVGDGLAAAIGSLGDISGDGGGDGGHHGGHSCGGGHGCGGGGGCGSGGGD